MHRPRLVDRGIRRVAARAVLGALLLGCGPLTAQRSGTAPSTAVAGPVGSITRPQPVATTFAALAQARLQQDYTAVQVRRFVDAQNQVVSVREQLVVDANGTDVPSFRLDFLGVEGHLPGSALHQQWQQTYARYGSLFHAHGSFTVRDLTKAQQNYTLHDFGLVVRAARQAMRNVVFPDTNDKSIWIVDVDVATAVPLYWAEFDFQFRLLAEVEVVTFQPAIAAPVASANPTSVVHTDYTTAKTHLGNPPGLVALPSQMANYALDRIETRDDPLNGQQKLVATYTDGVDEFLVGQAPGTADVFAGLMPSDKDGTPVPTGHTIARFQDAAMRVLLFWEGGVSFQVAGRGSLARLDAVAQQLFLQAISTQ